jgi:hypothetical protein
MGAWRVAESQNQKMVAGGRAIFGSLHFVYILVLPNQIEESRPGPGDKILATIYQRVLRDRFDLLCPTLRRFLSQETGGRAFGRMSVRRPAGRLRNLAASALGIPSAGEYDLVLEVTPHAAGQRWVRRFGAHTLESIQTEYRGLLIESSGPGSLGFELIVGDGALFFRPCRAWVLGMRLPLWLAPCIEADNRPSDSGGWRVQLRFRVPLFGLVGEYEGDVMPDETSPQKSVPPTAASNPENRY